MRSDAQRDAGVEALGPRASAMPLDFYMHQQSEQLSKECIMRLLKYIHR